MTEEYYLIERLHCAGCCRKVEQAASGVPGVEQCEVSLATRKLRIRYDESLATADQIMEAIRQRGFGARRLIPGQRQSAGDDLREQRVATVAKRRILSAGILSALLLYLSMGQMFTIRLPVPDLLSIDTHPLESAIAQFFLTFPVLWLGRDIFIDGLMSMYRRSPNMHSLVTLGCASSFLYSIFMTVRIPSDGHAVHHLYYESAALVLTFVMIGRFLEGRSLRRTGEAIRKMTQLVPETAVLLQDGTYCDVPVD
ncbi:MAG: cation transporter, partial [Planctomycetia bacterium]|nr:cation transporter [Planctomycetia bacterium]